MNNATSPGGSKDGKKSSRASSPAGGAQRMRKETDADQIDFNKKILHMSWHPQEDSIAIAATNNVSPSRPIVVTFANFPLALRFLCIVSRFFWRQVGCWELDRRFRVLYRRWEGF